jgi:hypothetical protein
MLPPRAAPRHLLQQTNAKLRHAACPLPDAASWQPKPLIPVKPILCVQTHLHGHELAQSGHYLAIFVLFCSVAVFFKVFFVFSCDPYKGYL